MEKVLKIIALATIVTLASCAGSKSSADEDGEENKTTLQTLPPIDLYFMRPNDMVVTSHNMEDYTAYLPDFVSYPNDLVKLGLKGNVKSVELGEAGIMIFTFDFNPEGNLTNQQFRALGGGEGHRMEYDAAGRLTFLGRDFRRQSPDSHTYSYDDHGNLIHRQYGRGFRTYQYTKDDNGVFYPLSVDNHGLVPSVDMNYERMDDMTLLKNMNIKWPYMPSGWSAERGELDYKYNDHGQLIQVNVLYSGCKAAPVSELFGECKYEYNGNGNVSHKVISIAKTKEALHTENALRNIATDYNYQYDEHGNWISCAVTDLSSQKAGYPTPRRITYYSEVELEEIKEAKKEEAEHPFIGQWQFSETEVFETEDGEQETVKTFGTIVLNLYQKFKPDYEDNTILGLMRFSRVPQYGMEQGGGYTITEAKLSGNKVIIEFVGYSSGDKYSGELEYIPATKEIRLANVKFISAENGVESDFEGYDLDPVEATYKFIKRSTSNQ